jgi:hypothetical protein
MIDEGDIVLSPFIALFFMCYPWRELIGALNAEKNHPR